MIEGILSILAPHYCCACAKIGTVLCTDCEYNIIEEPYGGCVVCGLPSRFGVCARHELPYSRAWVVAGRHGTVERLLDEMKFRYVRAAAVKAGQLLAQAVPNIASSVVVVPVPTIAAHVRQRGYDHSREIARTLARSKGCSYAQPLKRQTSTRQVGSGRSERISNAKAAFVVDQRKVSPDVTYLLVDDIFTTGATAQYAAQALKDAGAADVWLAVVARQELD